jgi:hypothetical protein
LSGFLQQQQHMSTGSNPASTNSPTNSSPGSSSNAPDPFTAALQAKAEAELAALMAARANSVGADSSGDEGDSDDNDSGVNPETGACLCVCVWARACLDEGGCKRLAAALRNTS